MLWVHNSGSISSKKHNLCHSLPSIEYAWKTVRWSICVFTFFKGITKVNTYLVLKQFVFISDLAPMLPDYVDFRRKLAWQLIDNQWLPKNQSVADLSDNELPVVAHDIATAPNHASEWKEGFWIIAAKARYQ